MATCRPVLAAAAILAAALPWLARAADAVKVGELNSYTTFPAFTLPYRNGWQLAVEEVNAKGGVIDGRPLAVITRDDGGRPGDAVTVVNELMAREGVQLIAGTLLSSIGLAVSDVAKQRRIPFLAAEPLSDALTWSRGNRYTFRLRPSTFVQASILVEEAAKLPAKRWAIVAPDYEYGRSAVDNFKRLLMAKRPEVEFVTEQWPALNKLDPGPVIQAIAAADPEAIFNVTFAGDLAKFVREGQVRGLFKDRAVVSLLTGEPEYLEPLGREAPEGWIVTGYPWYALGGQPAHKAFVDAYRHKFGESPRMGSLVGYTTFKAIAAALDKAGSTDADKIVAAFEGLTFDSPIGPITFRAADHQSTMGAWIGRTATRDGKPVMVDWRYVDGAEVLPTPEQVKKLRPAG